MPNDPKPSSRRLWRLLVLDREPGDPKWIVATVAEPGDVRPAMRDDSEPDDVTRAWAGGTLTALPDARVWRLDGS